jgi:hypothetical protein
MVFSFSLAPITATASGLKNASREDLRMRSSFAVRQDFSALKV